MSQPSTRGDDSCGVRQRVDACRPYGRFVPARLVSSSSFVCSSFDGDDDNS